jgi:hypothetical protein
MIRIFAQHLQGIAATRPAEYLPELRPALVRFEGPVLIYDETHPVWKAALEKYAPLRAAGNQVTRTRKPCGCGK